MSNSAYGPGQMANTQAQNNAYGFGLTAAAQSQAAQLAGTREPNVGERLNNALGQLTGALDAVRMIEARVFGPTIQAVEEGQKNLSQPHLHQTATLLEDRTMDITQRLHRIVSAL